MKPASPIHLLERDYFLRFNERVPVWPPADLALLVPQSPAEEAAEKERTGIWLAGEWSRKELKEQPGAYLCRELKRFPKEDDPPQRKETWLRETILRFPSAPLFGLQGKQDYQVRMDSFSQHTLRLLTSYPCGEKPETAEKPAIKKIFLIFNGLNEIDFFEFYYDLASLLIGESREIACLISPFPAHLTRYPLIGRYAEKPLQRFILDPGDLFRQYLRFMVEMQWLLSVLVPVSYYPVTPGLPLLAEDMNPEGGRCNLNILARTIFEDWQAIYEFRRRGPAIVEDDVRQSVATLRELIGWQASKTKLVDRKIEEPLDPPQIHAIGYSLGGYLAQSVFFTWPFAIGSCTTLCSGGSLHSLRPEKIIHEEEWRSITHGLNYEIESGLLEGRLRADNPESPQSVCGIPVCYFTPHFQTFNDIFLQDPHGSYRHRVSEFAPRLFFVVGGNDPIVSTQLVIDTSPPGGINMIEIAKLSHFIALESRQSGEWPSFWLPTIAGIISSLSEHSETLLRASMLQHLWNEETTDSARGTWLPKEEEIKEKHASGILQRREKADRPDAESLDSSRLQGAILQLADRLHEDGFLLILRNQLPVTMMGRRVLHHRGTVPHYADAEIRNFWQRLQEQRLIMLQHVARIMLVVPGRLNEWFIQRPSALSVKHLTVVRECPDRDRQKEIWEEFLADWEAKEGTLYRFDPEPPADRSDPLFQLECMIRDDTATPEDRWVLNCLPDTWISLPKTVVRDLAGARANREEIRTKLIEFMCLIYSGRRNQRRRQRMTEDEERASKDLKEWLEDQALQVVRISAAQSSPRFLGERIWNRELVTDLLTHTALALARSQPCLEKGDFKKGWGDA